MAVHVPGQIRKTAGRPMSWGPGNARKIGFIGTFRETLRFAPWSDPSWEFWANMSAWNFIPAGRADILWEMHPSFVFEEGKKNGFKDYAAFISQCRTPVVMQQRYEAVPAALRYPIEQIETEFPGISFGSQTAYQIAWALLQGVTDIGLWGIEYGHKTEYARQRGNCQLWLGLAIGRGVKVHIPPGCTLLNEMVYDISKGRRYGYDLTPEQYEEDKKRFSEAVRKTSFQPAGLVPMAEADLATAAAQRATDPVYVEATKAILKERIPDEFLETERKQRAAQDLVAKAKATQSARKPAVTRRAKVTKPTAKKRR